MADLVPTAAGGGKQLRACRSIADFDAASARTPQGYTSVFRIPFASLRFSSDARTQWRIMVARRLPRDQAYMWVSVSVPTDATHIPVRTATAEPPLDPPAERVTSSG